MAKEKLSVSLEEGQVREIEHYSNTNEIENRSKAIRELIEKGLQYDEVQQENERLRNEKGVLIERRDKYDELNSNVEKILNHIEKEKQKSIFQKIFR